MAAYQKLADLAYMLYQRTLKASIDWEEAVTPGVYQASFSDYSIQISLLGSQITPDSDVKISVIDDNGNEIESFSDVDIEQGWLEKFKVDITPFKIMYETYEIARRSALGTEQAINKILSELVDDAIPF